MGVAGYFTQRSQSVSQKAQSLNIPYRPLRGFFLVGFA